MKVTLRKRVKHDKVSLYLDYYHKGKRQYEYLRLYLVAKPRNPQDRAMNNQTLQLAESVRAKRQIEIQNGMFGFNDTERINTSFLFYFEVLTEKRKGNEGNFGNWMSTLKHLKAFKRGKVNFTEINNEWLEDFKHYLVHEARSKNGKPLSQNSCVSYFNKLKSALKQAVKDGIITNNPGINVDGIKEAETMREFLTLEELQKAAKIQCDLPILKNAFLFSALTGLRFSDIEKLTWAEVQHSDENGYYLRFRQKKTKGQETLPISEEAFNLLGVRQLPDSKVFQGLSYSDHNNQKLREWMIRAGIEKDITFHCARHTYATLQLTLGTDIYTVSKLLGHKSMKTTAIYTKVIDKKKQEAANRIKLSL
jgi:integrase